MYFYHYYNLNVSSDLLLPELISPPSLNDANPDVSVRRGTVAESGLVDGEILGPFLQTNNQQLWLSVPNVARFLISNGNEIIYEPVGDSDEDSIRVFMLGSCTGALLFQRGYLVLHGNAFEVDDGCVICVGTSGAGKSTLAAALMQRGHRIIADDVCPIDAEGNVLPGMPRIKLWQDSANKLNIDTNGLQRIRPELHKFNYPLGKSFCDKTLPVKAIYILNTRNESEFGLEPITGMDKYIPLRNNTYRLGYLQGMKMDTHHLKSCSLLATRINLSRIYRPKGNFKLDELVDFLLDDLAQQRLSN